MPPLGGKIGGMTSCPRDSAFEVPPILGRKLVVRLGAAAVRGVRDGD